MTHESWVSTLTHLWSWSYVSQWWESYSRVVFRVTSDSFMKFLKKAFCSSEQAFITLLARLWLLISPTEPVSCFSETLDFWMYYNCTHVTGLCWKRACSEQSLPGKNKLPAAPLTCSRSLCSATWNTLWTLCGREHVWCRECCVVVSPGEPLPRWVTWKLWHALIPSSCPGRRGGPAGWLAAAVPRRRVCGEGHQRSEVGQRTRN